MEDNFNLYDWNNKRRLAENKLDSISDMMSLNDKRVNAITKAIANEFGLEISPRLQGVIRVALADYMQEDLDIDQNINKDDEGSSFNITRGGDDPRMGAELESDKNVVGENQEFLEDLADKLSRKFPKLKFIVREKVFDRIDVRGSQQDLMNFGRKYQGQQYRGYEVFAIDDEDRGEVVRIVNSDSIFRGRNESIKETLRFIKENNPEFTNEEIKAELYEIKALGKQLNEKLCPKGEAYRKRRMAAGEKSSAYLSGRAVKVCKGQMSGKKKKK